MPGVAARISGHALLQHSVAQEGSRTDAEAVGSGLRDSGAGRLGDFNRQSKQQDGGRLSLFSGKKEKKTVFCSLTFLKEEIVTVKFGSKSAVYRRTVMLDRPNAPVFVDKHQQGFCSSFVCNPPLIF